LSVSLPNGSIVSFDSPTPETRASLLARLSSASDRDAWTEFVELYTPVIFRTARYLGLQASDADDVVQQVLISVARTLQQRPHDAGKARFRTWLATVTRNATVNALSRVKPDRGTGDSALVQLLNELPASDEAEDILQRETERELFQRAAAQVRREFAEDTWQAFWLTMGEGSDIAAVAKQLGKQPGSIYAARSRIIRRMREVVCRLSGQAGGGGEAKFSNFS
jgi:RNA polymerase sigma factor (sigma-70 family)